MAARKEELPNPATSASAGGRLAGAEQSVRITREAIAEAGTTQGKRNGRDPATAPFAAASNRWSGARSSFRDGVRGFQWGLVPGVFNPLQPRTGNQPRKFF